MWRVTKNRYRKKKKAQARACHDDSPALSQFQSMFWILNPDLCVRTQAAIGFHHNWVLWEVGFYYSSPLWKHMVKQVVLKIIIYPTVCLQYRYRRSPNVDYDCHINMSKNMTNNKKQSIFAYFVAHKSLLPHCLCLLCIWRVISSLIGQRQRCIREHRGKQNM